MKRISKCCVVIALAAILAFNCSVFSNAYTSQAAKAKPKTQTVTVVFTQVLLNLQDTHLMVLKK